MAESTEFTPVSRLPSTEQILGVWVMNVLRKAQSQKGATEGVHTDFPSFPAPWNLAGGGGRHAGGGS